MRNPFLIIADNMYKSLFIDLDDTLWAFSENARDTFREVYEQHGLNNYFNSFEQFYSLYEEQNQKLWQVYGSGKITREELNRQRFLYPLQQVGVDEAGLAKAYSETFFEIIPTKSKLMPFVPQALEYLSSRYRLYILSNGFRELQVRKMKSAGIEHYFRKVILSEDIRVLKPYPDIFYFALSATQTQLKDALMIGDSWENDIAGAKGVGMSQLFYNPLRQRALPFQPTYHMNSWNEIARIL